MNEPLPDRPAPEREPAPGAPPAPPPAPPAVAPPSAAASAPPAPRPPAPGGSVLGTPFVPADEAERRRPKAERQRLEREREAEKEEKKRRKREEEEKREQKKEKERRGRGVETLFRTSYAVNMDLTALADAKANIMVSVNAIFISIVLSGVAPGIEENTWLVFPTAVLLLGITAALIFGVLAARPRVESRDVSLDDVRANRANLLFFGHFANMSRSDFVQGMQELMDKPDAVYQTMAADVYGVGSVLQKKYRLLRWSYTLFILGIALGVVAFVGTFYFRTPPPVVDRIIIENPAAGGMQTPAPAVPLPVLPAPTTP
jgi:hypothetical protein